MIRYLSERNIVSKETNVMLGALKYGERVALINIKITCSGIKENMCFSELRPTHGYIYSLLFMNQESLRFIKSMETLAGRQLCISLTVGA